MQPTPNVNRKDVLRVIARDFPEHSDEVLRLLRIVSCPLIGADRLHLALLKLADGSLESLQERVAVPADSRDVVSRAEYPAYNRKSVIALNKLSDSELNEIFENDWQQYCDWLEVDPDVSRPSSPWWRF
jgi:hypothetical protein